MPKRFIFTFTVAAGIFITGAASAQESVTLEECIKYAVSNQPQLKQAQLDREIAERDIQIGLADWYPQLNATGTYNYNAKLQATPFPDANGNIVVRTIGLRNTSILGARLDQTLYSNEVLLASRAAKYTRKQAAQNIVDSKIALVSDVNKAFFDILLTDKQLAVLDADIVRLKRSLSDAQKQYQGGIRDKVDYKRAGILLNNSLADRKRTAESIKTKEAYLKQVMGFPPEKDLSLKYDTARMEQEAMGDTSKQLDFNNRIEYQLLQTQKQIQDLSVSYYKWGFLPSLGAFATYNLNYFSNDFSNLYAHDYPNSVIGLSLNLPVFNGLKRIQNLRKSRLQEQRIDLDITNLKNQITTEYTQAIADYRSNLNQLNLVRTNMQDAAEVYKIIDLQYREGVKTYLEVITAQADLRSSQLNYYNSLFQLISSRVDVERALGTLPINF
ncbi:MAG: TolC family protein [Mucilaginibacter polytrichastri]|nr:TolC family protein [Mucilaginibacter polytrichastri]